MLTRRKVCLVLFAAMVATVGLSSPGRAEDKAGDVTGTWKWTFMRRDGQTREVTAKLKQDGENLTGTVTGRDNTETAIQDGKVKDGKVTFKVTRRRDDREFTMTYEGTLSGDTIKGKTETNFNGQTRSRDWEAKRA